MWLILNIKTHVVEIRVKVVQKFFLNYQLELDLAKQTCTQSSKPIYMTQTPLTKIGLMLTERTHKSMLIN